MAAKPAHPLLVTRALLRTLTLLPLALIFALYAWAWAQEPVFFHFDEMPDNTSVEDLAAEFAANEVNFYSDYSTATGYRAAPFITSTPNAGTSPHVLVNRASGGEIFSSQNVPLRLWFSQAVSGVGMQLECLEETDRSQETRRYLEHPDSCRRCSLRFDCLSPRTGEIKPISRTHTG